MYKLEYFNGKEWTHVSEWANGNMAWISLGGDTYNYRLLDPNGKVIKSDTIFDKSKK